MARFPEWLFRHSQANVRPPEIIDTAPTIFRFIFVRRAFRAVMQTRLGFVLGVVAASGVLAACGDGATPQGIGRGGVMPSGASPAPAGVNPGAAANPGSPTNPTGTEGTGTPAGGRVDEGNPPVMVGFGDDPANGGAPSGGGTPSTGDTPIPSGPVSAGSGEPEPTNCVIPAALTSPIGYGAATTGGGDATPVIVNSFAEAEAALAAYRAAFEDGTQSSLVLRYTGTFDYGTITDVCAQHSKEPQLLELKEMDNVTFEGASGSSANFGIHINRAHNVIVRNMTMGLLPGGDGSDALTVEGNGTNGDVENVWIDHNELFSSTKDDCDGAGDTEFDGLIDIKKGARSITVSYNYLHDHQKTGLLGFSDSDDTERYVTFHHNRYENVVSRTPLQRFGFIHIFNNYYGRILDSGINVRMGGVALIESNFFENAANPITSRFTEVAGSWELRNNHVGPGITWDVGSDTLANADSWQSTTTFPAGELDYAYSPDEAGCVKQIVFATAGAIL
jgi:pectate lyase